MRRVGVAVLLAGVVVMQEPTVKPVASVQQLMDAMVIPSSNALFDIARQAPVSDDDWAAIQNSAVLLAESGNLLMLGSRARDTEVWMSTSKAMVEAGELALGAAEARDVDAMVELGNQIMDACETCHASHLDRTR